MMKLSIDDRLAKTKFDSDDATPHILIDKAACATCQHKSCTFSCPAERYRLNETGEILFDHVGCLECGNCRLICERLHAEAPGYKWDYPKHGKGVVYRFG